MDLSSRGGASRLLLNNKQGSSSGISPCRKSSWGMLVVVVAGMLLVMNSVGSRGLRGGPSSFFDSAGAWTSSSYNNGGAASSTSLANRQSLGFFTDLSDDDWKLRQERAVSHRHQANAKDKVVTDPAKANMWYLKNYYPLFTCPHQQRVGVGGDGPKWMCDPHRLLARPRNNNNNNKCLVYSIGSNGNYKFEDGLVSMLGRNACEIHVFDMSKDYARPNDPSRGIHFHHWGLGSSYSTEGRKEGFTYRTLQDTMKTLGHEHRTIDVFKIDCENCEWTTYKDWISDTVDIRQLMIETHGTPTNLGVNPADFFEDIERAGFAMYSKEPNIHMGVAGKCVEFSYIKLHKEFFGTRFDSATRS